MPTERLSMRKIHDVLRLRFETGLSQREIVRALTLSNGSVNSYLQRAPLAGLRWPLAAHPDDGGLESPCSRHARAGKPRALGPRRIGRSSTGRCGASV
jgi:hypothetical protein